MNLVRKVAGAWKKDQVLGRVVRNSGLLFASNIISAVVSILTANILGVKQFGVLSIIMAFVSNINRLLSFKMGDVVVRYMGAAMATGEKEKAAAVVKAAILTETATSITAYIILAICAPLGAKYIAHDPGSTPLILVYGLSILGMLATETSTGVLQVGNQYRSQSVINLLQTLITALVFVYAALTNAGIWVIMAAYLAGKLVAGIGPMWMAHLRLKDMLGEGWWKASFALLPPRKELLKFAVSTNFSGTINMIVRDSEVLWVGWLFTPEIAGYYKNALAVINLIILPINPFIATTYPEITRSISLKLWKQLRVLLRRVTVIAGGWTAAVILGLAVLGRQVLYTGIQLGTRSFSLYKAEYLPSLTLVFILLIGYGIANSFYWNRSLLLAFDRADSSLIVSFWGMIVKVILTITVVPRLGYVWEAWLMSAYLAVTVLIQLGKGLSSLYKAERMTI